MGFLLRAIATLLFFLSANACVPKPPPDDGIGDGPNLDLVGTFFGPGALGNPSIQPIGGGEGYGDWVVPQGELVRELHGPGGLLDRLAYATPGEVISVADDARIDLSDQKGLMIREGVTLAGGRGRNGSLGGLLFSTDRSSNSRDPVFYMAPDSRLTGLRIQGPSLAHDFIGCESNIASAIHVEGSNDGEDLNVRIDNMEIYGWSIAVRANRASGVTVDHSHIHHNQRSERSASCEEDWFSLGYGVVVYTGKEPQAGEPRAAHARSRSLRPSQSIQPRQRSRDAE